MVVEKINHINQVLVDYEGALEFYKEVFGAKVTFDGRQEFGPYNNAILYIGPTIIEIFSPCDNTGLGKITARYGDTWQGVELKTARLSDSLDAVTTRNLRVVDHNPGRWFFTLPSETHGVCLEIVESDFDDDRGVTNPFGVVGLKNLSVAVRDLDAASAFYADLVQGADVIYREERPQVNAAAVGINFGADTIEFLSPSGPGALADYIDRYRPQIRGITLQVESLDAVEKHLAANDLTSVPGDAPGTIAIAAEKNYGVLYQFSE
jgi:catechol 2,3-dioxygenase-like lactoylglutathione lyase family enzyme